MGVTVNKFRLSENIDIWNFHAKIRDMGSILKKRSSSKLCFNQFTKNTLYIFSPNLGNKKL